MPMLDAYIPEGALDPDAEKQLMGTLTNTLLTWEGADPEDERARSIGWVFLHRPATVYAPANPPPTTSPATASSRQCQKANSTTISAEA